MRIGMKIMGDAKTQGSKRAMPARGGGRPVMVEQIKGLPAWREAVRHEAALQMAGHPPMTGACELILTVARTRPKSHYRANGELNSKATDRPIGRNSGDADKLARAVLDAMTAAGVWGDDAQCWRLVVIKEWTSAAPHAYITVGETAEWGS